MTAVLPALLCLATGWVIVLLGWPPHESMQSDFFLKASLSIGCGLGIFSLTFFVCLLMGFGKQGLIATDITLLIVLLVLLGLRLGSSRRPPRLTQPVSRTKLSWIGCLAACTFALILLVSLYASAKLLIANPHGTGWDAIKIWNQRARFLFRAGPQWRVAFSAPVQWSHPDYPLLLPASVAHFWKYLGTDSAAVPAAMALAFTFCTVGFLVAALSRLRGKTQAFLGGAALLGTPYFMERGVSQFADVPLSFFFLATVALFCLQGDGPGHPTGLLGLAGITAGLAAWTKNEGLLFLVAVVVAQCVAAYRSGNWRECLRMAPFVAAALPIILVIGYFKLYVAGPGDLLSPPAVLIQKLSTSGRYWKILGAFLKAPFLFGHWVLVPAPLLGVGYAWLLGKNNQPEKKPVIMTSGLVLGLTAAGYFVAYLITPYDLSWHLRYSLNRLLVQLWPSMVFLFFMTVRTPEQAVAYYSGF